jgi:YD repeat-containing protein
MRKGIGLIALLALPALPCGAVAQRNRTQPQAAAQTATSCIPAAQAMPGAAGAQPGPPPQYQAWDVVVDVPNLCVQRITLEVDNLRAHLSLDAAVANLVTVQAGADVNVGNLSLTIRGVRAQALLLVDLDNVVGVVDRTLTFVDNHPEIVTQLTGTVQHAVGTVGGVANTALQPGGVVDRTVGAVGQTLNNLTQPGGVLTQTVNTLGQTVQTTLDQTGNLVERTLSTTGQVVNTRSLGALTSLPVVGQATNAAGQAVRTVRTAAGQLVEYTVDQAGRVIGARVVQQAAGAVTP